MEKRIARLSGHYIICGGGQTGKHVLSELVKNSEQVVLIENSQERIDQAVAHGIELYIQGDATEDDNMVLAGIKKARGIIISLPVDKDNLYITMAARMLNPDIRIIARMIDSKIEAKLRKAGANGVVSPNFIGGLRMASEMIRPTVVSFLDKMLRTTDKTLRIHEIFIHEGSSLSRKTIQTSGLRDKFGLLVLGAIKPENKDIEFNPQASLKLLPGTTLVVMGEVGKISQARDLA